jgi:hypothetical protein
MIEPEIAFCDLTVSGGSQMGGGWILLLGHPAGGGCSHLVKDWEWRRERPDRRRLAVQNWEWSLGVRKVRAGVGRVRVGFASYTGAGHPDPI